MIMTNVVSVSAFAAEKTEITTQIQVEACADYETQDEPLLAVAPAAAQSQAARQEMAPAAMSVQASVPQKTRMVVEKMDPVIVATESATVDKLASASSEGKAPITLDEIKKEN
jgi:hypothetical protein